MVRVIGLTLVAALTMPNVAMAHDTWSNGDPVPAWVKAQCCGVNDAHHLRPDQVHVVPGGYKFDGYDKIIPQKQMQPSPDNEFWIFYSQYPDGSQTSAFCVFGPVDAM